MNPPRRLTNDEADEVPNAWTADGKAILLSSDRNGPWGIFKEDITTGTAEPLVTAPVDAWRPFPSPDGTWVLYLEQRRGAIGPSTSFQMMRVPVNGGPPQPVLVMHNYGLYECARLPSSLCALLEASQDEKQFTLTAFDPLKGRGQMLRAISKEPGKYYASALAPDGTAFAISESGGAEIHIRLLSLSGQSDREITLKGWPNLIGLDWTADGKGLYCVSGLRDSPGGTLLFADLKGNARVLGQLKQGFSPVWAVPSPNGRDLAISVDVANSNVWLLEGF